MIHFAGTWRVDGQPSLAVGGRMTRIGARASPYRLLSLPSHHSELAKPAADEGGDRRPAGVGEIDEDAAAACEEGTARLAAPARPAAPSHRSTRGRPRKGPAAANRLIPRPDRRRKAPQHHDGGVAALLRLHEVSVSRGSAAVAPMLWRALLAIA
ncbi:hypothetical protein Arub01_28820 [Actinomadura rubrobrunea]|uniref:Uncharacterized protein n=1 Tax=Actinomadura rubrobrunea TaxID=115335 RepID=A0A9W6UW52_9ACTN|nr:hypothetical protein Arub01_28820 [Actinomadura rubrobrunea]